MKPETVEEAAALLERVANDRVEYIQHHHDDDVALSIDMLRAAARIILSGDVKDWVPSWRWHEYEE